MGSDDVQTEHLVLALMEQLKMPLLQIAHHAELAHEHALNEVGITAERALSLVDNYLLAVRLNQQELQFEPVSVSSVLYDVAHQLTPMAKQYNCDLELRLDGKYQPVMSHKAGLHAALVTLGQSFIEAEPALRPTVVLAGYKSRRGITTGLFTESGQTPKLGISPKLPSAVDANIYVADSIFQAMAAKLYAAKHRKLNGLAVTLMPSTQLQII